MMTQLKTYKITKFEYFYIFIMVIYMAHMTPETRRMVEIINGNPIPFLLPIALTFMLLRKHHITWDCKKMQNVIFLSLSWTSVHLCFIDGKIGENISYYFFLLYALVIAYIHVKVFNNKLFLIYESVMIIICQISIVLWGFAILFPNMANNLFNTLPSAGYGHHLLYIFNLTSKDSGQSLYGIIRNSGCSWEPGRFAVMICFAILFNIGRKGIDFSAKNKNIYWLLAALISTMSTTGYLTVFVLYAINYTKKINFQKILIFVILFIPLMYGMIQMDFIGQKLESRMNYSEQVENVKKNNMWYEKNTEEGRIAFAIDRFSSMYFELQNIADAPIWGYGKNTNNSLFYKTYTKSIGMTGGFLQMFGIFGIALGLYFYFMLYRSSVYFNKIYQNVNKLSLMICFMMSLVSYPLFGYPLFTAFWLMDAYSIKI